MDIFFNEIIKENFFVCVNKKKLSYRKGKGNMFEIKKKERNNFL